MKLERVEFVATISVFFAATTLPILGMMPVGAYLARFLSRQAFDRIILAILTVLAVRIVIGLMI